MVDNCKKSPMMCHQIVRFTLKHNTPSLYEDSVVTVSFNRISGDFAAIGPIDIYRYEYEGAGGGPMAQQGQPMHHTSITVFPNPFKEKLDTKYLTPDNNRISLKIYDVAGRLVKQFNHLTIQPSYQFTWYGEDETGRSVAQGVYFIRIDYLDTDYSSVHKVLKIR